MNTAGTLNNTAKNLAADALHRLSCDATADKGRRQAPTSRLMAEDKHLNVAGRKKLIGTTRDLYRNFAAAAVNAVGEVYEGMDCRLGMGGAGGGYDRSC